MSLFRLGELERRVSNLFKNGKIEQADYSRARVRVRLGDNLTGWLPWASGRACGNKEWDAPEIGEQVLVICNGDLAQGFVIPGVFSLTNPANGQSADVWRRDFKDGAFMSYDRAAHAFEGDFTADGSAKVTTGDTFTSQKQGQVLAQVGENVVIEATASQIRLLVEGALVKATADEITLSLGNSSISVASGQIVFTVGGNQITLAPGGTTATAGVTVSTGDITASSGDVIAKESVSLHDHIHTGGTIGGLTGKPEI